MKVLKNNSKLGQYFLHRFNESKCKNIYDAYERPSGRKVSIYYQCLEKCDRTGGHNFKIISAGAHTFTVAWEISDGLIVETYANIYLISDNYLNTF